MSETIYEAPHSRHGLSQKIWFSALPAASDLLAILLGWAKAWGDAMTASRRKQAERDIAWRLQLQGGTVTDAIEREIERQWLRL